MPSAPWWRCGCGFEGIWGDVYGGCVACAQADRGGLVARAVSVTIPNPDDVRVTSVTSEMTSDRNFRF